MTVAGPVERSDGRPVAGVTPRAGPAPTATPAGPRRRPGRSSTPMPPPDPPGRCRCSCTSDARGPPPVPVTLGERGDENGPVITFHWFLPTSGDSRDIVGASYGPARGTVGRRRRPSVPYLAQIAQAAEQLGF